MACHFTTKSDGIWELLLYNEYLVTENRILRNQMTGHVRLTDGERQTLAEIGQKLTVFPNEVHLPGAQQVAEKPERYASLSFNPITLNN
jgi:hypothetical protein